MRNTGRGAATRRVTSVLSSKTNVHGEKHRGTEVPRDKLLDALESSTKLISTMGLPASVKALAEGKAYVDVDVL